MSKYLQYKLWVYNTEWLSGLLMRQTVKEKESNMKHGKAGYGGKKSMKKKKKKMVRKKKK